MPKKSTNMDINFSTQYHRKIKCIKYIAKILALVNYLFFNDKSLVRILYL
jgi:hypothetical protein